MSANRKRNAFDAVFPVAGALLLALALLPALSVLVTVVVRGAKGLSWSLISQLPPAPGETGGGIANAIVGSLVIALLASVVAIPAGLMAGIFMAERPSSKLTAYARASTQILASVPPIVIGVVVYVVAVVPMRGQSAIAGAMALAALMLPPIVRGTDDRMRRVPRALREGALALGAPRWRASIGIALYTALPGILAVVAASVARALGEAAPLLFTSASNQGLSDGLFEPTSTLPVQVYRLASSPYDDGHAKAWSAALVLLILVLGLGGLARLFELRIRGQR